MTKRKVNYPHTIGFRVTDQTWVRIEQEIAKTDLTPHDWCRLVVLDKLDHEYALSKNEMVLFQQVARIQWILSQGFNILAHGELTVERWDRFRAFARNNADRFAELALNDFRRRTEGKLELESLPDEDGDTQ
jgi:hypothetical protein